MSGGHYPYPKHIWTPTGGWWHTPKNYKSNTLKIGSVAILISFGIFKWAHDREYDPRFEVGEDTMKRWNNAAAKSLK